MRFIKRPLVYCILFFLEDNFWRLEILVLTTKNKNLEARWPQDFFLKV